MLPGQRQKRDIDAKADYGEIAVHHPANHLEGLRGPRPSVYPGGFGGDQLIFAAAMHGRRASQPLTEAVHLDRDTVSKTKPPSDVFRHLRTHFYLLVEL